MTSLSTFCIALAISTTGQVAAPVDFAHTVVPILKAHCAKCHTNGTYKGGASFDTRETLLASKSVVPGKAAESELVARITSHDEDVRMPPEGTPLSQTQISVLIAWIDNGLAWEPGFSFKKKAYVAPLAPRRPALPPAQSPGDHPIDRIIAAYQKDKGVSPTPPLDDAAFARRAFLDLIGQLPAESELDEFLLDAAPDKHGKLIDRLLAENRAYADHWLSFWNDLLRNDYAGTGYIDGGRKQITAWLYQSLLDNKRYDRFVRELIDSNVDSEGFAKGIKWRGTINASQVVELQFSQNVGQVFFGINLKCASCHDSFIDHWKLDEAYGLAAIVAEKPLEIHRCDKATGRFARAAFIFPELGSIDSELTPKQKMARLADLVVHPENGRLARTIVNRLWHRLMGRGIVEPVDAMEGEPWSADLLDYLASYLVDRDYDLKALLSHIATSKAYGSRAVAIADAATTSGYVFRGPHYKRMTAEQYVDALWQLARTAPEKPAPKAPLPSAHFGHCTPMERQFVRASLSTSDPLMRSLGRPNREQVVTTRPDELSTLQAIDLANGPVLANIIDRGAKNWLAEKTDGKQPTADEMVNRLFRSALSREPTPEERTVAMTMIGSPPNADGLADLMWTMVMLPEFQLVR